MPQAGLEEGQAAQTHALELPQDPPKTRPSTGPPLPTGFHFPFSSSQQITGM